MRSLTNFEPPANVEFDGSIIRARTYNFPEGFVPTLAFRAADFPPIGYEKDEIAVRNMARNLGRHSIDSTCELLNEVVVSASGVPSLDGKKWEMLMLKDRPDKVMDSLLGVIKEQFVALGSQFESGWGPCQLFSQYWPELGRVAIIS